MKYPNNKEAWEFIAYQVNKGYSYPVIAKELNVNEFTTNTNRPWTAASVSHLALANGVRRKAKIKLNRKKKVPSKTVKVPYSTKVETKTTTTNPKEFLEIDIQKQTITHNFGEDWQMMLVELLKCNLPSEVKFKLTKSILNEFSK